MNPNMEFMGTLKKARVWEVTGIYIYIYIDVLSIYG